MTPDPRRIDQADLRGAGLDAFAAKVAEAFAERRRYTEAPQRYHEQIQFDIQDWVESNLLGLCLETPESWDEAERLDAAVERRAV